MIEELGAGKIAKGYLDVYPQPFKPLTVKATAERINRWLGTALTTSQLQSYLKRVAFEVQATNNELVVTVPTYRQDVTHMADLAEEVARLFGYNNISTTIPASQQVGERT